MAEIQNSYFNQHVKTPEYNQAYTVAPQYQNLKAMPLSIRDEFVHQHKKNGLAERFVDYVKNLTGLGLGSKKLEAQVEKGEKGEVSEESVRESIAKYRNSQANVAQGFGDVLSIGASGMTFFALRKKFKMKGAEALLNERYYENQADNFINVGKKINEKWLSLTKSKPKFYAALLGATAIAGGLTKYFALKFNRIGSKEYKTDKKNYNGARTPYDKAAYKLEKKLKNSERHNANFRNFASGAINGLMMPLTLLGGAIVGIPAYFVGNNLNRYFIGNKDSEKTLSGYFDNLKDDGLTHATVIAATAVPMVKKAKWTNGFDKNLSKTIEKLVDADLTPHPYGGNTVYEELSSILLNSKDVREVVHNDKMGVIEQINALTKENLFAVKFKQISKDGSKLTNALRENCPATRTLEEAQDYINKQIGNGYTLSKCLGVGTVAETYLAKGADGKEVCIKILKDGIDKDKILADKQKFIDVINEISYKTADEKEYFIKNIDDMADGLLKELDFENELVAAKKLAEHTKLANVVKPIEVKNGVYVMEKANGISLSSLIELNAARNYKYVLEKNPDMIPLMEESLKGRVVDLIKEAKTRQEQIKIIDDYIAQIEARTPEFGDITLTRADMKALIEEYQQVLVEQFSKVEKNGKVLHADIHPGNIFIDINALRNRKKDMFTDVQQQLGAVRSNKIFTLIDTGNTVNLDVEQSLRAINLSSYIKNGNTQDIAEYVIDGANLGKYSKDDAVKLVKDELDKIFFDNETYLDTVTSENLINITSNIMRKHGITPSDTQFTLNKARQSAQNSFDGLIESLCIIGIRDVKAHDVPSAMKFLASLGSDAMLIRNQYKKTQALQEKLNLKQLSLEQRLKQKNNPNMLKTNSEEHLTYKLKQKMKPMSLNG